MVDFRQSEREAIERDALSSLGKTPEERVAMLVDLLELADAILDSLPPEERLRRAEIARQLDPLPEPWWKNFSAEALAQYRRRNSETEVGGHLW